MKLHPENQAELGEIVERLTRQLLDALRLDGEWIPVIQLHSVSTPGVVALWGPKNSAQLSLVGAGSELANDIPDMRMRLLRAAQEAIGMSIFDTSAQIVVVVRNSDGTEATLRCDCIDPKAPPRECTSLLQHALTTMRQTELEEAEARERMAGAN